MKKILFVIPEYSHGGTNKSLENLLSLIDKRKYEISIYCLYEDGSTYYKKTFAPYIVEKSILYYWLHDNVFTRKFIGLCNKLTKPHNSFSFIYQRETLYLQRKYHFDMIVSYQEGVATEFVSLFMDVRKIAWVHCMYGNGGRKKGEKEDAIYSSYHQIICVSNSAAKAFIHNFPNLSSRVDYIYNLLDTSQITLKGNAPFNDDSFIQEGFTIISVGRIAYAKQLHEIPSIINKVIHKIDRQKVRWYIIGEHINCEEQFYSNIRKYGLENTVCYLGVKDNPYPYIKHADLLVCPSLNESFSYVINEALVLHTPVLANNFPVAYEMINDNWGFVCPNREMHTMLLDIINDKKNIYSQAKRSITNYKYDNSVWTTKIERLLTSYE